MSERTNGNGHITVTQEQSRSTLHSFVTQIDDTLNKPQGKAQAEPQEDESSNTPPPKKQKLGNPNSAKNGFPEKPTQSQATTDGPNQGTKLADLFNDAFLFHTPDDLEGYATLRPMPDKPSQTLRLASTAFKQIMTLRYYRAFKTAPGDDSISQARNILEAKAVHDGPELPIYTRVAETPDALYLNLCNAAWEVVKITATGWKIIDADACPVRFVRFSGMGTLPVPQSGGSLTTLKGFLSMSDEDWILTMAWLLACYRTESAFPILAITGEQGTAKSTTSKMLRRLIDPSKADVRQTPKDDQSVMIAAKNGWVLAYDNLSSISAELSNTLCMIATGGGMAVRKLYTTDEEVIINVRRPIILNSIGDLVSTKDDLNDRALPVTLKTITREKRKEEKVVWADYFTKQPQILGAICDALSQGLCNLPKTELTELPRMADFYKWAIACEPAFTVEGKTFADIFTERQKNSKADAINNSQLMRTFLDWYEDRGPKGKDSYDKPASVFYEDLTAYVVALDATHNTTPPKWWPGSAGWLVRKLKAYAPALRAMGVDVDLEQRDMSFAKVVIKAVSM